MHDTTTNMDLYEQAHAELAEIEGQIAELQSRRDTLRDFIQLGQSLFDATTAGPGFGERSAGGVALPGPAAAPAPELAAWHPGRTRWPANMDVQRLSRAADWRQPGSNALLAQSCEKLIEAHGPLHTRALLQMLALQDLEVPGPNPMQWLSALLSRSEIFRNDRRHGWSLAERVEPAGRSPSTPSIASEASGKASRVKM